MSDERECEENGSRKRYRPVRVFALGWLISSILLLLVWCFVVGPRLARYTGTAIFQHRSDVAAGRDRAVASESFETIKQTLRQDLAGREAVARVVEAVGLTKGLPHDVDGAPTAAGERAKQDIVAKLRKQIKIEQTVESRMLDLISVSVTHADPELARDVPNALVQRYIELTSSRILDSLTRSRAYLERVAREAERERDAAVTARIRFEARHAGMMPESPGALQQSIEDIRATLRRLRVEKKTAERTLATLKDSGRTAAGASSQPASVVAINLAAAEAKLEQTASEIDTLEAKLGKYEDLMRRYAPIRQEYLGIGQKVQTAQATVGRLAGRLAAIREAQEAEAAKSRTHLNAVELAEVPTEPDSVPPVWVLAGGVGGGLVVGGLLSLLAACLNRSVAMTGTCLVLLAILIGIAVAMLISGKSHWSLPSARGWLATGLDRTGLDIGQMVGAASVLALILGVVLGKSIRSMPRPLVSLIWITLLIAGAVLHIWAVVWLQDRSWETPSVGSWFIPVIPSIELCVIQLKEGFRPYVIACLSYVGLVSIGLTAFITRRVLNQSKA